MKMTREQVADLLLRMNNDCSNVVLVSDICEYKGGSLENMLKDIANGWIFKIKDNSEKEITKELRGKWCFDKFDEMKSEYAITAIDYARKTIHIDDEWHNIQDFNERWQLVED